MSKKTYCLITPAKNEEKYISKTIRSIICQTVLPQEWIIVNDGSTDKTGEIIQSYARKYHWIKDNIGLRAKSRRYFSAYRGIERRRVNIFQIFYLLSL